MLLRERMKLIGWFLSHDLLCACGILKSLDVFLDAARTRLEKNERVASIMSVHTARLHLK